MNTTNPRPESRSLSYDDIQLLLRQGRAERSRYIASSLLHGGRAIRRWGRHLMRRLGTPRRTHDLSGRPA